MSGFLCLGEWIIFATFCFYAFMSRLYLVQAINYEEPNVSSLSHPLRRLSTWIIQQPRILAEKPLEINRFKTGHQHDTMTKRCNEFNCWMTRVSGTKGDRPWLPMSTGYCSIAKWQWNSRPHHNRRLWLRMALWLFYVIQCRNFVITLQCQPCHALLTGSPSVIPAPPCPPLKRVVYQ